MHDRLHDARQISADRGASAELLRGWRRRDLVEARARYDTATDAGTLNPGGRRGGMHRRLSAWLGDWLARRAIPLAAYGDHRRRRALFA